MNASSSRMDNGRRQASVFWIALLGFGLVPITGALSETLDANAVPSAVARRHVLRTALLAPTESVLSKGCSVCQTVRESGADFTAVDHADGGPSRIILMRHADKTDDPDDEDLSEAGAARAQHLATYIPQTFGKPDYIIATAHSKHSNRPRETVAPLAAALGMKVEHDFENDDFEDLVEEIFSNPDYKGRTLVICWHHGKLPAIAALLGASTGSYPDPWPEDAYNIILDFRYDPNSGSPPTVTRVVEPF
jgi:phosphohistidine phosphatase SixA